MRLNQFIAQATGISRRKADEIITAGKVHVNGQKPELGQQVSNNDEVTLDGQVLNLEITKIIMLNKPVGYVCSRDGQGSRTVYDLLPPELHSLKLVGRLDKDSSGLLLLTNNGDLANQLTHPRYQKSKIYEVVLNKPLAPQHHKQLLKGVPLEDGPSKFSSIDIEPGNKLIVTLAEGRNRQIRRTFAALGYKVTKLHRTQFGPYTLSDLAQSEYEVVV